MTSDSKMYVRAETEIDPPDSKPRIRELFAEEDFNSELEKGINDFSNGNVISAKIIAEKINRKYGV
ncbi:hypothetical protein [Youngiibacter fragilis]|uniref:RelB antitoxin n=1 Tax=Youngiibacter fragilis 232.1 TaxID=994573 RepID=V7I230_9CLOT|nr:hypothetical protein [Youngiibacter fragilis]ETA79072.1 RelB antitoxin [Youngiibacter fragilis 232.1]